jgi:prepilin-type N-terminal cleavage/methylation domain-containing protein
MAIRNKKGFTLIELVVAMAVLSIVMGLIVGLVTQSLKFFGDEDSQVASQASLRQIAVEFEKNVRKYVITPTEYVVSGNCYTISPVLATDPTTSYCYDSANKTVTRNGVVIGEKVGQFTAVYNTTNHYITLLIQSVPDGYGRVNEVNVNIYIRIGS